MIEQMTPKPCVFCEIVSEKIPCQKIYEDSQTLAFHDIRPTSPIHFLVIPKQHFASLFACTLKETELLGKILLTATKLACQEGLQDGFRTIINTGNQGGQEVFHLHVHVIGGAKMGSLKGNIVQ